MRVLSLFFIHLFFTTIAHAQLVVDDGEFLTEHQAVQLSKSMRELRDSTRIESLIYTTMDLEGQSPMEYGMALGDKYPVGVEGVNNGILILLSKNNRKFRIFTGTGLEWELTDEQCQRITNQMIPFFKKGDFFGGLNNALGLITHQVATINWEVFPIPDFNRYMTGQVFKMKYKSEQKSQKPIQIPDSAAQFSPEYYIDVDADGAPFNLYYSKYMTGLISKIQSSTEVVLYFRLADYNRDRLELLGVE